MTELIKTPALVVYATRWRESSKIVHLFTRDKGYVKVIAKGAMRPKSPFRGVLEIMNYIEAVISVRETRGLQILSEADLLNPFSNIREDLPRTALAFSMLELIKELIHYNEPAATFFNITRIILERMNLPPHGDPLYFFLFFLLQFSDYLGFGWDFAVCEKCGKLPGAFPAAVDLENGGVICATCASAYHSPAKPSLSESQWRLLNRLNQLTPDTFSRISPTRPPVPGEMGLVQLLLNHLRYHTDQALQLKSLKMYLP